MDIELTRIPKRKEPLNLLTGVFLKSVYFLDSDFSKCVTVGLFKNRGDILGLAFKGRKGVVFWSNDNFNEFSVFFNDITLALENNSKFKRHLDSGHDIKTMRIFGKPHVFLYDGEHTLSLTSHEWTQFVNNLPLIHRELRELFMNENYLRSFIADLVCSEDAVEKPKDLPESLAGRLFDEVQLYKRWPNGGCS